MWLALPLLVVSQWSTNHNFAHSGADCSACSSCTCLDVLYANSRHPLPTFILLHGGLGKSGDRKDLYEVFKSSCAVTSLLTTCTCRCTKRLLLSLMTKSTVRLSEQPALTPPGSSCTALTEFSQQPLVQVLARPSRMLRQQLPGTGLPSSVGSSSCCLCLRCAAAAS